MSWKKKYLNGSLATSALKQIIIKLKRKIKRCLWWSTNWIIEWEMQRSKFMSSWASKPTQWCRDKINIERWCKNITINKNSFAWASNLFPTFKKLSNVSKNNGKKFHKIVYLHLHINLKIRRGEGELLKKNCLTFNLISQRLSNKIPFLSKNVNIWTI